MLKQLIIKLTTGFFLLIGFILGIHRFAFNSEVNKCEMTYMFEYPQYIPIEMTQVVSSTFPDYKLFVYGEGKLAEKYYKRKFVGIPVLFIPGNAGSYKQVRSLASMAYRKSLDSKKHFHFDFFTIDFNEELSALYGGVLEQQTAFANECIQQILSIYKDSSGPQHKSLLLIGHSMGGIIAKAIFTVKNFDPKSVHTIITLATPHKSPVITLDEDISAFYLRTSRFWGEPSNHTDHVALASIGGADRDIQVRSGLTAANTPTINVLTTEIPTVWLSTDHLCIVWCKQVVSVVVRSLFDMVDHSQKKWIKPIDLRNEILSYHYVKRSKGKHFEDHKNIKEVHFDPDGRWRESVAKYFTASVDKNENVNNYFMIPLVDNAFRDRLVAVASSLPIKYWVFGCAALAWTNNVRFCESGIDLSGQTLLLPNAGDNIKRKLVYLDLVELKSKGFTHVVFNIPKNHHQGSIIFDVHRSLDRKLENDLPLLSYAPLMSTQRIPVPNDALSFNITLPQLEKSWQSIALKTTGRNCPSEKNAFIRKVIPWAHESQFFLSNETSSVHLHVPRPHSDAKNGPAFLQFINSHPGCQYEIELSFDWVGMWAQLVQFYSSLLLPLTVANLLYCFSMQLRAKQDGISVPSTLSCLLKMPVIKLAFITEVISIIVGLIDSSRLLSSAPFLSFLEIHSPGDGFYFPLMYFFLGGVAWSLAIILTTIFSLGISAGGNILHTFFIRYLRSSFGFSLIVAELIAMGLSRIPIIISVALVSIAYSTCGSVGIFLGLGFFIWKLFSYFEDELESMLSEEENQEMGDDFHFNMTIALLWLCTGTLSLPTFIVWVKNPSLGLPSDYTLYPSIAWNFFGMMALQDSEPLPNTSSVYGRLANLTSVLNVLVLVYGLVLIYRIQYFVIAAVAAYATTKYYM